MILDIPLKRIDFIDENEIVIEYLDGQKISYDGSHYTVICQKISSQQKLLMDGEVISYPV